MLMTTVIAAPAVTVSAPVVPFTVLVVPPEGGGVPTVITPLVASRVYQPFALKRTSYEPAVVGADMFTVAELNPGFGAVVVPLRNLYEPVQMSGGEPTGTTVR